MATKKAAYVEPESYFSPNMKKAMREYEQKKAAKEKTVKSGKKSK